MLSSLDSFVGVNAKDLGLKLIPMGCDSWKVFQGTRIYLYVGDSCSIHDQSPLFCSLNKFGHVVAIEIQLGGSVRSAIQAMYVFFLSPKKYLEF